MTDARPTIRLLRDAQADDPYEAAFERAGFAAHSSQVLSFEVVGAAELQQALSHPERFGGVIITSPRAAEILADALAGRERSGDWYARPAYAVGPRTADILRTAGFEPVGEESGTGTRLAEVIVESYRAELPLLFLAGDRRRPELPARLSGAEIAFEEITVYRTQTESPSPNVDAADWLAFFSPSGVEAWLRQETSSGARIAAIGETTAAALREAGFEVDAVAQEPTPESLLEAVRQAMPR